MPRPTQLDIEQEIRTQKVLSGFLYLYTNHTDYIIAPPTYFDLIKSRELYLITLNKSSFLELMTEDDIENMMIRNGLWSIKDETEFENIPKNIENLLVELYNGFVAFRKLDQIRKQLSLLRKRHKDLSKKRYSFFDCSRESVAANIEYKYLVWSRVRNINLEKVFVDFDNTNETILSNILREYTTVVSDIIQNVRAITKGPVWRSNWNINKKLNHLFKNIVGEYTLTDFQRQVVNWSIFYDNVYEHMESPPQEVIEDDDLIDGWSIVQDRQHKKDKLKKQTDDNIKNSSSEVFVVVEDAEKAKDVYALNDGEGHISINQRMNMIKKHGSIKEEDLPDSQIKMRMGQ